MILAEFKAVIESTSLRNFDRNRTDNVKIKWFRFFKKIATLPLKLKYFFPWSRDVRSSQPDQFAKAYYLVFTHMVHLFSEQGIFIDKEDHYSFFEFCAIKNTMKH